MAIPTLSALTLAEAMAIAEASAARTRDERAMIDYMGIGRRRRTEGAGQPPLVVADAVDLAAFEGGEQRHLRDLVSALSVEARRELIALVWVGQSLSLGFAAALRRTRRIPPEAQAAYLTSRRLEKHVPAALDKLRLRRGAGGQGQ
jgi:hypothetical protein